MTFFSGFCFHGEEALFEPYLIQNDFTVAGFSYGAIKAFEYTLTCQTRIDTLQLFSPAFFQHKDAKFKKLQTLFFTKDSTLYTRHFRQNTVYPSAFDVTPYLHQGSLEELNELLNYVWDEAKLHMLVDKGVTIEVYTGECDAVVDSLTCKDFFVPFASVYYVKRVGHLLK
ncbi:pimelyl-ACP methyl ester esterase BioV [Sulfurospirillum sp. MES]|uniref:pimelyl-ACP methyl ester esterase BioV n=1 Tax=Sulfurospirillum sp. MES TaxID=1565314 RepID=UPI0005442C99|nr:pimelyl-ACP methyl ester esterase BioV [Sulfurospirillum sp. MES]KHG33442.1 MAG: hypothetical protein OA34_09925 [Sulfurospirillum sp. MES]